MLLSRTSTCIGASGCVHWACLDARSPGAHALGVTRSNIGAQIGRCRSWARVLPMAMTESHGPVYMGTRGPNSQTLSRRLSRAIAVGIAEALQKAALCSKAEWRASEFHISPRLFSNPRDSV